MNARADFDQMESRPGGGGAGGCVLLMAIILVPVIALGWTFWPVKAKAAKPIEYQAGPAIQGRYTLFPGRPDWADLGFEISAPKLPGAICADPVTLPWSGEQMQSCASETDPVI